jgi:hypothetical protein
MSKWPHGSGEMAQRIHAYDWASTPLGPIETWPLNLRTSVDLTLGNPIAALLLWGSTYVQLYDGHWRDLISEKHPAALGRPMHESFPEIVETMEPIYTRVQQGETIIQQDTYRVTVRLGSTGVNDVCLCNLHKQPRFVRVTVRLNVLFRPAP